MHVLSCTHIPSAIIKVRVHKRTRTRRQGSKAAWHQGTKASRASRLQGGKVARRQDGKAARGPGGKAARRQGGKAARRPGKQGSEEPRRQSVKPADSSLSPQISHLSLLASRGLLDDGRHGWNDKHHLGAPLSYMYIIMHNI